MSRISIDVTAEEHQRLKALAALQGKSIKDFVLASTIGAAGADAALDELEAILTRRLEDARAGGASRRSVQDIIEQVKRETLGKGLRG